MANGNPFGVEVDLCESIVVQTGHEKLRKCTTYAAYTKQEDITGREFRSESQRRWSLATQKIKNILAVSDAISLTKNNRTRERAMSIEQKSSFLDKFSTRDRRPSGASFDLRRRYELGHLTDGVSNISSVELRDVYHEARDSKTNVSQLEDVFNEGNRCRLFKILFEPYSTFIYVWSWIVIMAIHYNSWVIILRIAFPDAQNDHTALWFSLDYTADLIYLIDILISSRMSFLENGIYVDSVKRVTFKYFKSTSCALDLVSLLPLDLLYIVFNQINPAFRVPRLVKFFKVFHGKKLVESMTNFPNMVRGVFSLHIMFLLMHWNCCFYYIISKMEGFGSNKWVYPEIIGAHKELAHQYVKCMYWSTLVLTTIGEDSTPETTIECVYMVICYITGIFIFATIVGQAGNVIQNMNASRMEFERQRDNTMQYMKVHNVPTHLQKRVRLWYDYTYSRGRFNGGDDINQVTMLPDKMKTELALHVHLETLRKVSFLQKCQPEFLHDLVLKMKLHIFTPGDFVIRKGEIAREMYVISDGMAEVVSDSGRVLKVLRAGDFFGEIGLLSLSAGQNRRTADVRSCGYIELFVLSKEDVMSSIRDYPDAQRILAKHGKKRLVLGSKAYGGPRDETTSGSTTDSEIELKITRADSDTESEQSLFQNNQQENTDREISKGDDDVDDNTQEHIADTTSLSKYLISPRNSVFLDMENNNTNHNNNKNPPSIQLQHCAERTHKSHGKVLGPATSIKSLDTRSLKCRKKNIMDESPCYAYASNEEIDAKSLSEKLLTPRFTHMRRANSDMQRRTRKISTTQHKRGVHSEGEDNKNYQWPSAFKRSSQSSISQRSHSQRSHQSQRSHSQRSHQSQRSHGTQAHKQFNEAKHNKMDEEMFVRSMKKLYLDNIHSMKRRSQSQIKKLKSKLSTMEKNYTETYYEKERIMNERESEMKEELFSAEDQMYHLTQQLRQKEEEYKRKEEIWRRQLDALKLQMESNGKKYDFNSAVIHV